MRHYTAKVSVGVGDSLSAAGDVNGDGYDDFLLGVPKADPGVTSFYEVGIVFVCSGFDGSIIYWIKGTNSLDGVGNVVAAAGDVNADGFDDFYVFGQATDTARLYSGATGTLLRNVDDYVWNSIAVGADFDRDGVQDICVGNGFITGGVVEVISGASGEALVRFEGDTFRGGYGKSVAFAGDLDGDGWEGLLIGSNKAGLFYSDDNGAVYLMSWLPLMSADQDSISAAVGGTINLTLDFPNAAAQYPFAVLFSAAGSGDFHNGVDIPLAKDPWTISSYQGLYPFASVSNLHGTLDVSGNATASFTVSSQQLRPFMIGRTIHMAVVAGQAGLAPAEYSSVAVPIEITL